MPAPMNHLLRVHGQRRTRARVRCALPALTLMLLATPISAAATPPEAAPSLGEALQAVVDAAMAEIRALEPQAKSLDDGPEIQAQAQAAIIRAKADLQRRLLEVQLDYARRDGRAELAAELEGILARLDRPATGVPQDRESPPTAPAAR